MRLCERSSSEEVNCALLYKARAHCGERRETKASAHRRSSAKRGAPQSAPLSSRCLDASPRRLVTGPRDDFDVGRASSTCSVGRAVGSRMGMVRAEWSVPVRWLRPAWSGRCQVGHCGLGSASDGSLWACGCASSSLYKGYRYPVEIISHCVWLYHRCATRRCCSGWR
jgi:hypothetical protein